MSEASDKIATGLNEAGLDICPWHGTSDELDLTSNGSDVFWVVCNKGGCGCEGPYAYSEAEAIAAWNRRATPEAALPVGVKGLEWSSSMVFGVRKWRGMSPFGEFDAFSFEGNDFSEEKVAARKSEIDASYEARIRSALIPAQVLDPAPGHTDLMVSPEEIDRFVEANPPPDPAPERRELVARLESYLRDFDENVAAEMADQAGERADLWTQIEIPVADLRANIVALSTLDREAEEPREVSQLLDAGADVISSRSSTFKARNGRDVGIQDEHGEKMWIVPFDEMAALEAALAALPKMEG